MRAGAPVTRRRQARGKSPRRLTAGPSRKAPLTRRASSSALRKNASQGLTIAADTETFTYDATGAILTANNHDALVSRRYYPDGLIQAETLKVRDYTANDYSKHVYPVGTSTTWTAAGRR